MMSKNNENGISLATPPAIHVGPIVNPGTNETISIVIPLSAQLATVTSQKIEKSCKDYTKDGKQSSNNVHSRLRNDKTKGCPYPGCTRYGRAFSRAHDLKRHIARHEMRKEKLHDYENYTMVGKQNGKESNENIANGIIDRQHMVWNDESRESKSYSCLHCKKKYTSEIKLRAHMSSHEKVLGKNVCALCGTCSRDEEELQEHMKQHTANMLEAQTVLEKSEREQPEKEDDFLLEEMLLLNKNPRRIAQPVKNNSNTASKIRCDYCSKTFKTKWTLSSHVAAHEGRFQFDCGQCGKKFVRKSHYEGHMRSHEAARPYVCEQCGKTFKELKHRREHTKRKHPTNQNAIQTLLDSISPCGSDELPVDQAKFTLLMPVNFSV
ncbi:zinc finger protein 567-like [Bombus pyrosoma]|uniref:zinc finger protein 567-like n=1 Tax=Bombus pyrosoma TaxID=396416 RepID=UPI001CB909B9|nr:zinc finger protein 567-like [Bombus pyrosoma]XP_043587514.1 zinc finger protein 567-like [Bombus pyrosoma]XP_043587515.1 zinc finger protein 567-like [Bombus pyrosoma]XP_043587516.1 zinc finger protein 567-like [Bombus pyrosoma]